MREQHPEHLEAQKMLSVCNEVNVLCREASDLISTCIKRRWNGTAQMSVSIDIRAHSFLVPFVEMYLGLGPHLRKTREDIRHQIRTIMEIYVHQNPAPQLYREVTYNNDVRHESMTGNFTFRKTWRSRLSHLKEDAADGPLEILMNRRYRSEREEQDLMRLSRLRLLDDILTEELQKQDAAHAFDR